jgi:hypothetical protein
MKSVMMGVGQAAVSRPEGRVEDEGAMTVHTVMPEYEEHNDGSGTGR